MNSRKLITAMTGGLLMWVPIAKALEPHMSEGGLFLLILPWPIYSDTRI